MGPNISLNKNDYSNTPNTKILTPKASNKETVFVLDWDDTLMCTSFIFSRTQGLTNEEKNIINNLGKIVNIFLEECIKYGKIIIMTNST